MTSIAGASWFVAPETKAIMAAFEGARPGCARFVGGCVRNTLMGHAVDDIDIATQLTPDAVTDVARKAGFAVAPTGIDHGTLTVIVNHKPFEGRRSSSKLVHWPCTMLSATRTVSLRKQRWCSTSVAG